MAHLPDFLCPFRHAENLTMHQNGFPQLIITAHGITAISALCAYCAPIPLAKPPIIFIINERNQSNVARIAALLL